jgi:hypothetical protein
MVTGSVAGPTAALSLPSAPPVNDGCQAAPAVLHTADPSCGLLVYLGRAFRPEWRVLATGSAAIYRPFDRGPGQQAVGQRHACPPRIQQPWLVQVDA